MASCSKLYFHVSNKGDYWKSGSEEKGYIEFLFQKKTNKQTVAETLSF